MLSESLIVELVKLASYDERGPNGAEVRVEAAEYLLHNAGCEYEDLARETLELYAYAEGSFPLKLKAIKALLVWERFNSLPDEPNGD